jgi:hypothetical protein
MLQDFHGKFEQLGFADTWIAKQQDMAGLSEC